MGNQKAAYAFFAGAGGLHLGIEQAGFKVAVATDLMKAAGETHKLNWPNTPFIQADIQTLKASDLLEVAGEKPFLIVGGPPCQGFSTLGAKISSDPRNRLFQAYARLVEELDPKIVVIENVKSITTMYGGKFTELIINTFNNLGYRVYQTVIDTADYGIPQHRKRAIFVATKLPGEFAFPKITHGNEPGQKKFANVGDTIMDLVNKSEADIPNHLKLNHSEIVVKRYRLIPEGGRLPSPEKLPKEIRRKNFGNTYKRLHRDLPSLTMVPGNNAFPVHPTENRSLTPREAARIQTFPDHHIFAGDRRTQCILVGNAVPPLFAKQLGEAIQAHAEAKVSPLDADKPVEIKSKAVASITKAGTKDFTVADLFSGAGGFLIGFEHAGWRPVLAVDYDKNIKKTHEINHPHIPYIDGDLSDKKVKQHVIAKLKKSKVNMIVGGPPCQGFSVFGKRRFVNTRNYDLHKDPRNQLVFSFIEIVKQVQPEWFLMENVPGMATAGSGYFLNKVLEDFKSAGYENVEARILNAADYGVPQKRRRLVIMGNRTGHIIPWPKKKFFEAPKDWQNQYRAINEVIADLDDEDAYLKHKNHVPMNHKPLLVERYKLIPEGERLDVLNLPEHLKSGYRTNEVKNFSHIYKRLDRNKPASTMVAGHNAFPVHPWLNRSLTVREAARIQTFPDQIEFAGNRQEQCIQVGNAFPALLAEVIAHNVKKAKINDWYPDKVGKSVYYSLVERGMDSLQERLGLDILNESRLTRGVGSITDSTRDKPGSVRTS